MGGNIGIIGRWGVRIHRRVENKDKCVDMAITVLIRRRITVLIRRKKRDKKNPGGHWRLGVEPAAGGGRPRLGVGVGLRLLLTAASGTPAAKYFLKKFVQVNACAYICK